MPNLLEDEIKNNGDINFLISTFEVIHALKDKMFTNEFEKKDVNYLLFYNYFYDALSTYFRIVNPHYFNIIETFKNRYINTEAIVEKNDIPEQIMGVRNLYDYIQNTDVSNINILVEALKINSILWKPTDDKNNIETNHLKEQLMSEYNNLLNDARINHDMKKLNRAREVKKDLDSINYKSKIGGVLRSNDNLDDVKLQDTNFKVPKASEALDFINSFASPDKITEFNYYKNDASLMDYIEYCIKINVELIKYQPFMDGNKRTFRGLLNLLFKVRDIPPIYIRVDEIDNYKKALFKAIIDNDYSDINFFYLFKICASIYELDIEPYLVMIESKNADKNRENAKKIGL